MLHIRLSPVPAAFAYPLSSCEGRITRDSDAGVFVRSDSISPASDVWVRDTAGTRVVRVGQVTP